MPSLSYVAPTTIDEAIKALAGASGLARVLAGGTDLLVQLRSKRLQPSLIVDTKQLPGLMGIKADGGGFVVGAATPCAVIGEHKAFSSAFPGVTEGANLIGSTQVQGRATLAGNLCNASPAADSVPALVAAGAKVAIAGPKGKRTIAVEQVPVGPGKTSLKKGEIIESILLPARPPKSGDAYLRFIPRTEMDIAVVGVGVNLTLDAKGVVTAARVSLGAVAPTVLLVPEAAKAIIGTKLDAKALDALAAAASAACKPIDDKRGTKDYRIKVAGVLAKRAAKIAQSRAAASSKSNA